jgi:multidrug transporter EmrE-like cation transporter
VCVLRLRPIVAYFTFRFRSLHLIDTMDFIPFAVVGILWGCTNPFIKDAQKSAKSQTSQIQEQHHRNESTFASLKRFLTEPAMFVPYIVNQLGSLVFFLYVVPRQPISVASPICNSLSFVFTAITSYGYFGEDPQSWRYLLLGIVCVLLGSYICMESERTQ